MIDNHFLIFQVYQIVKFLLIMSVILNGVDCNSDVRARLDGMPINPLFSCIFKLNLETHYQV
jgi:hypothetical protein